MELSLNDTVRLLERWQNEQARVAALYLGKQVSMIARAVIAELQANRLALSSSCGDFACSLDHATFTYEPLLVWPQWPRPPVVPVEGLKIWLEGHEVLFLTTSEDAELYIEALTLTPAGAAAE
jgi:hypothetical protein